MDDWAVLLVFALFFGGSLYEQYEMQLICIVAKKARKSIYCSDHCKQKYLYYLIAIIAAMSSGLPFLHLGQ
jgi:hypothetical protein